MKHRFTAIPTFRHNEEIQQNLISWNKKPLLRRIYRDFHRKIAGCIRNDSRALTVELGSGIGNIKEVVPNCLRTDLFPNPWLDQVENAYALSFDEGSVSNLILFDVFHHLKHPGTALAEFRRVLCPEGRVIIFDPYISLLGLIVFGSLHHEPVALGAKIEWIAPPGWTPADDTYYAAQGNATRVFGLAKYRELLGPWRVIEKSRMSCVSYIASGGYSKPQLYPDFAFPFMRGMDLVCDWFPLLFATRLLVVLEKR